MKEDNKLTGKAGEEIGKVLDRFDDAKKFELENYAGRVRDLDLGGGLPEILIPPVVGAFLANNILKGKTPEEKKENFLKGGGVGFVGGLATWMGTMVAGINGPIALFVSALSTGIFETGGRMTYKHMMKVKKHVEEQLGIEQKTP